MNQPLPQTNGGHDTPKPRLCEWCRQAPPVRRVELSEGRKVSAGWKAGLALHVCARCAKTIETARGTL